MTPPIPPAPAYPATTGSWRQASLAGRYAHVKAKARNLGILQLLPILLFPECLLHWQSLNLSRKNATIQPGQKALSNHSLRKSLPISSIYSALAIIP
jgi:hypothetical protein